MKILLVSPGNPDEIDNKVIRGIPYLFVNAFIAPHAIATVAALTPDEHEVILHDEYIRGPVENFLKGQTFDIIGITIISNQIRRSIEISRRCKELCPGALRVAGGIGVETMIQGMPHAFEVLFHGEAEETWPAFLKDVQNKSYKTEYKTLSKPDLSLTPPPRWELIKEDLKKYVSVSVQTTRGCPHDCSFCDVIYVYGRKPRAKSIEQVLEEIRRLEALGVEIVFIADDNFSGDRKYVKELLRRMIELNNSFRFPLCFYTQLDITIAQDEELLQLLADANFYNLMIGIESINPESLKDLNKKQNMTHSIPAAIEKIQSYGMVVLAHMIIGADSDDRHVFENTARFINETNVVFHICHPLAAPPGTRLWYDLKRSGRIVKIDNEAVMDKFDILSNINPQKLTRLELFEGLADYWDEIYKPKHFIKRAKGFMDHITYKPRVSKQGIATAWKMRKMIGRVMRYFLFEVEKEHRKTFFALLRHGMKDPMYFVPKVIYLYTFYLMDVRRSLYDASEARAHAQWEREHPHEITIDDEQSPLSDTFRTQSSHIVDCVYSYLRPRVSNKEHMMQLVVQSMMEFHDRHRFSFREMDAFYKDQLLLCADRVLEEAASAEMPDNLGDQPPVGFAREMLDALDSRMRYRELKKTGA